MIQNHTPAQLDALRNSFINAITSNAPAGVNIKTAVKRDGVINIHIMNAPAELYDFSAYTKRTRCVKVDDLALKANAALADIWAHLVAAAKEWSAANNGATLSTAVYIGSPSRSFVAMAKDTRAPRQKAAAVEGLQVPASLGVRDGEIVRAMWGEVLAVLADYHTKEEEHTRPVLDRLAELRRASAVWFIGDNTPRAYNFAGFRVECAPADLPVLFARYCKAFRVRYVAPALIVEAEPSPVAEVAPVEVSPAPVVENIPAEVEAEPSPVAEVAPVEVSPAPVVENIPAEVEAAPSPVVEAGQMIASRAGVRVAHGVNVAAWVLIVAARRAEAAAEYINNI